MRNKDFPSGSVGKNLPANARNTDSIPDPGRSHMPRSNWAHAPQLLKSARSRTLAPQLLSHSYRSPRTPEPKPELLSPRASTTEARAPQSPSRNYWAHMPQLLKPVHPRAQGGTTEPTCLNYWSPCTLEPKPELLSPCAAATEACVPRICASQQDKPPQWEALYRNWRVAPVLCS